MMLSTNGKNIRARSKEGQGIGWLLIYTGWSQRVSLIMWRLSRDIPISHEDISEKRLFQDEGRAPAEDLRQEHGWHV